MTGNESKTEKRKKIIRIASVCVFVVVMIFITIICIPVVKMLSTEEGRKGLEKLVEENFLLGLFAYLFLQILQVVVALIPGGVIQILGGVLFGNLWGILWCSVGIFLGTVVVFYVVRRFGMPIVEAFIDGKGIKRFEFLGDAKKLEIVIFILFLMPGVPKDVLTYIVPLTKIKPKTFFIISAFGRLPAITLSTVFGANLGKGNIVTALIIFAVVAVAGVIGILYSDKAIAALKGKKEELGNNRSK